MVFQGCRCCCHCRHGTLPQSRPAVSELGRGAGLGGVLGNPREPGWRRARKTCPPPRPSPTEPPTQGQPPPRLRFPIWGPLLEMAKSQTFAFHTKWREHTSAALVYGVRGGQQRPAGIRVTSSSHSRWWPASAWPACWQQPIVQRKDLGLWKEAPAARAKRCWPRAQGRAPPAAEAPEWRGLGKPGFESRARAVG